MNWPRLVALLLEDEDEDFKLHIQDIFPTPDEIYANQAAKQRAIYQKQLRAKIEITV